MSAHRDQHLELAAGWLLDALGDDERREFEAHLASGCDVCRAELARLSEGVTALARSAPAASPRPEVRARVLEIARAEAAGAAPAPARVIELPRRRAPVLAWAWAAAAAVLAVVSILGWRESARLKSEAAALRAEVKAAEDQLAEERRRVAVMGSPEARVAELAATPDAAGALRARATFDPRTRNAVIVFSGLRAPTDRDFQLWAMRASGLASLGVIHADADGNATIRVEVAGDAASLQAFAVSLEPRGGSPNPAAPTGPVVMVGKLGA